MFDLWKSGKTQREIGVIYGISAGRVGQIVRYYERLGRQNVKIKKAKRIAEYGNTPPQDTFWEVQQRAFLTEGQII